MSNTLREVVDGLQAVDLFGLKYQLQYNKEYDLSTEIDEFMDYYECNNDTFVKFYAPLHPDLEGLKRLYRADCAELGKKASETPAIMVWVSW